MPYLIQQEQRADLSLPWAILVSNAGQVLEGRPDAASLLGFQRSANIPKVNTWFFEPWDIKKVIGTFPVFTSNENEGIFVVLDRIESIKVVDERAFA